MDLSTLSSFADLGLSFLSLTLMYSWLVHFYRASDIIVYYSQSIKIQIELQKAKDYFFKTLNRNCVLFNGLPAV